MRLTPMRYKDYIWPSNPGSYRISFRRVVAEHKLPFGRSVTQDLGQVCRVLEGEGAGLPLAYPARETGHGRALNALHAA